MVRLFAFLVCGAVLEAGQPVRARHAMVATGSAQATEAGVAVLKAGGNAVDAAVAVGFALSVTHSANCGLGGGGYLLARFADGRTAFLDFRERAPAAVSRSMPAAERLSGWRAAAVPGTVMGLELAAKKWGRKPWAQLVEPSIGLAERGSAVSYMRAQGFRGAAKKLERFPESKRIFLKGGALFEAGDTLVQAELAETLKRISRNGAAEFYEGETARRLAQEMEANGGAITLADLRAFHVSERAPLSGTYRGYRVITAAPSTAGGLGVLQMLGVLEGSGYEKHGAGSAASIHWMVEAMRRFHADRSEYIGDPDFVKIPVEGLLNPAYTRHLRESIDPDHATPSERIRPGKPAPHESADTTHYSIVDAEGNAVAVTFTLNGGFGSAVTVPGLGFLLNNNMDNFSAPPGETNQYGLPQGEANAMQPGKRPVSSMAPTIVERAGKLHLVLGTPGGPTITTAVLQTLVNVIDFGMNAQEAVDAPRFHHQWVPDKVQVERGFSPDTIRLLEARGHKVEQRAASNDMNAILVDGAWLQGAVDSRRDGKAAGY